MPNLRSLPVAIHHFSTFCVKAGECHTVCRGVPCTPTRMHVSDLLHTRHDVIDTHLPESLTASAVSPLLPGRRASERSERGGREENKKYSNKESSFLQNACKCSETYPHNLLDPPLFLKTLVDFTPVPCVRRHTWRSVVSSSYVLSGTHIHDLTTRGFS